MRRRTRRGGPTALHLALVAAAAVATQAAAARAQRTGPMAATARAPSVGDVAPGVYRAHIGGVFPVRFVLRGSGSESIGVNGNDTDNDPSTVDFTPACATPCTLWFAPGPYLVQLGRSPLRERVLELPIERHGALVHFTRDSFAGVASGVALAGLGLVAMIVGVPRALDDRVNAPGWWSLAVGGVVLGAGGAVLSFFSLGTVETRDVGP